SDLCASFTCGRFRNNIGETHSSFHLRPLAISYVQFHCTGCARILFPTTEVPARASFATSNDCHMSKFTCDVGSSSSAKYFTSEDQTDSDPSPGANDDKIAGRLNRTFLSTSLRFIDCSSRCVVLDEHRHLKVQHLDNRKVAPSQMRRIK